MSTTVTTPVFRLSYPKLFKAELNKLNGKEEFSLVALFPKGTDLTAMQKAAQAAIEKKWGTDPSKWPKPLKNPFRKHEEREKDGKLPDGHEPGGIFMNLKSERKPTVVDQNVQEILDPAKIYAGCFVRASINFYAYDQKGNRGVSAGLGHVQLVRDGDPLGNVVRVTDAFAPVETGGGGTGGAADAGALFS